MENPFILYPYKSKDLFCDREFETEEIIRYLQNGRNITLISPRRLGKTGLIYRVFDELSLRKSGIDTFYVDISSSQSAEDFIKLLAEAVVPALNQSDRITSFFKALGGIRPVLSYDSVSGKPEISMTFQNDNDRNLTLKEIFNYLERHPKKVVLAIDEFQQVREYKDIDMEALLRTYVQPLRNVSFIFCGSKKHTMTDIFSNAKRPFYESTTFVSLGKLDVDVYAGFIIRNFQKGGKKIDLQIVRKMIEWTRDHTFYTQTLCNEVYMRSGETVTEDDVFESIRAILSSNRDRFLEIQRLLTPAQWRLLKALAKEGSVAHPTAADFLQKYRLGSGAAVSKNLKSLIEKELILPSTTQEGTSYSVYNVFLSRYLEKV